MVTWTMNDNEKLKRIIKQNLDVRADRETYHRMRDTALGAHGHARRTPSAIPLIHTRRLIMKISTTRIALAALICVAIGAATVVAVNVGQYYYLGRDQRGHAFISDDGQSVVTMDDEDVQDVRQTQDDLQEMKLLSDQGKREVIRVIEISANGHPEPRLLTYKYQLADGRTREMGEAAPEDGGAYTLTNAQNEEMIQLKEAGPGEDLGTYEEDVQGRTFVFRRQQYLLSDGTKILWSIGKPKNNASH